MKFMRIALCFFFLGFSFIAKTSAQEELKREEKIRPDIQGFRVGISGTRLIAHYAGIQASSSWVSQKNWGVDVDHAYLFFNNRDFDYSGHLTGVHLLKYFNLDQHGVVFLGAGYHFRTMRFQDKEETFSRLDGRYFQSMKTDSRLTNHALPVMGGLAIVDPRIVWSFTLGIDVAHSYTHKGRNVQATDKMIKSDKRADRDLSFFRIGVQIKLGNRSIVNPSAPVLL